VEQVVLLAAAAEESQLEIIEFVKFYLGKLYKN